MLTLRSNLDFLPKSYLHSSTSGVSVFTDCSPPRSSYFSNGISDEEEVRLGKDQKIYNEVSFLRPEVEFEVIPNQGYSKLTYRLKHIAEAIIEAHCILKFKEDWDGDCANATDEITFKKAVHFLLSYSTELLKYGIVAKPYIDIMRDGAVSIFWETNKATLLIIFNKGDNGVSYFYGEEKNGNRPFRYAIESSKELDEILLLWMKKNLL